MDKLYQHCLLALDLSSHVPGLYQKTEELVSRLGASLSLIHVHERDVFASHIHVDENEYLKAVQEHAIQTLKGFSHEASIPLDNFHLKIGSPKQEIAKFAKEKSVDLIIVGSHSRTGLARLLGSTASGVLNSGVCDVHVFWCED